MAEVRTRTERTTSIEVSDRGECDTIGGVCHCATENGWVRLEVVDGE